MFSAMLFAIAIVALLQFALYYLRAMLTGVACQPVSQRVFDAAQVAEPTLSGDDFGKLLSLHALTPRLEGGRGNLLPVRCYYAAVQKLSQLFGGISPVLAEWTQRERLLCARFAAVQVERRLQCNLAQAAEMSLR
ncbi:MAG: hypothetical protein M3N22_11405 [Acidobacteriota bacterium]|nr:hypothetical protein [Acidobacteriota bacterium]